MSMVFQKTWTNSNKTLSYYFNERVKTRDADEGLTVWK